MSARTATLLVAALLLPASAAYANDMLPLDQGLYVDANMSCKGPAPGDTMSYAGGNKGVSPPQFDCVIQQLGQSGTTYNMTTICTSVPSGQQIPLSYTLVIKNSTAFSINGHAFRYCGRQFLM